MPRGHTVGERRFQPIGALTAEPANACDEATAFEANHDKASAHDLGSVEPGDQAIHSYFTTPPETTVPQLTKDKLVSMRKVDAFVWRSA